MLRLSRDENNRPLVHSSGGAVRAVDAGTGHATWLPAAELGQLDPADLAEAQAALGAEVAAPVAAAPETDAEREARELREWQESWPAGVEADNTSAPAAPMATPEPRRPRRPRQAPAAQAPATNGNGNPICPYCRQAVLPEEQGALAPVTCEGCGVAYHAECWQSNGGRCAVYGCRSREANGHAPAEVAGRPAEVAAEASGPLAVDLEPEAPEVVYPAIGERPDPVPPPGRPDRRPDRQPRTPRPAPSADDETPEEVAARRALRLLRLQREAAEERARIAAAEAAAAGQTDREREAREEARTRRDADLAEQRRREAIAQFEAEQARLAREHMTGTVRRKRYGVTGPQVILAGVLGYFGGMVAAGVLAGLVSACGGGETAQMGCVTICAFVGIWVGVWLQLKRGREGMAAEAAAEGGQVATAPAGRPGTRYTRGGGRRR